MNYERAVQGGFSSGLLNHHCKRMSRHEGKTEMLAILVVSAVFLAMAVDLALFVFSPEEV